MPYTREEFRAELVKIGERIQHESAKPRLRKWKAWWICWVPGSRIMGSAFDRDRAYTIWRQKWLACPMDKVDMRA